MSEHIPLQSEDPLPQSEDYSHRYNKAPQGDLDRLVVTDPRDPFVWLTKEDLRPYELPSTNGKHLLWFVYRMNGNVPQTEFDIKWRDDKTDMEALAKTISRTDLEVIDRYQHHLAQLDAEEAVKNEHLKPQLQETAPDDDTSHIKLHEPNSELIFAAIMQHLDLISGYPKAKQ